MKKTICLALVLVLFIGVFVSCSDSAKKTVVGTWVNNYSVGEEYNNATLIISGDGSVKWTQRARMLYTGDVLADFAGELTGTYTATSEQKGTITLTAGYATITVGGQTQRENIPEPITYQYEFDGANKLTVGEDIFNRQ